MWLMRYVAYYVEFLFDSYLGCFSGIRIFLSSMANVMFCLIINKGTPQ